MNSERLMDGLKRLLKWAFSPRGSMLVCFTCRSCGNVWYVTRRDLSRQKVDRAATMLGVLGTFGAQHYRNFQASLQYDVRRCARCGTVA